MFSQRQQPSYSSYILPVIVPFVAFLVQYYIIEQLGLMLNRSLNERMYTHHYTVVDVFRINYVFSVISCMILYHILRLTMVSIRTLTTSLTVQKTNDAMSLGLFRLIVLLGLTFRNDIRSWFSNLFTVKHNVNNFEDVYQYMEIPPTQQPHAQSSTDSSQQPSLNPSTNLTSASNPVLPADTEVDNGKIPKPSTAEESATNRTIEALLTVLVTEMKTRKEAKLASKKEVSEVNSTVTRDEEKDTTQ